MEGGGCGRIGDNYRVSVNGAVCRLSCMMKLKGTR